MINPKTEQELWEQAYWEAYDAQHDQELMDELIAMDRAEEEADNTDDPGYSEWEDPGIPKY